MRTTMLTALALASVLAAPVDAQQPSAERRREIERRIGELERQMRDLRRELERLDDGPRPRVRVEAAPRARARAFEPRGFTIISSRPKFGFQVATEPDSAGAKVMVVSPGSPADRAGLKTGDVVTMFNGVRLSGHENPGEELMRQAADLEVGDTVHAEYRRGSEKKQITMVAEDLGGSAFAYGFGDDSSFQFNIPRINIGPGILELGPLSARWLDVELVSLNRDLGEYFGTTEGVLVVRAPRDSALNLKSGDVILAIDGRRSSTPTQALRILRSYERGESFEMQVLRQKKKLTLTAKVPARDRGYFWNDEN